MNNIVTTMLSLFTFLTKHNAVFTISGGKLNFLPSFSITFPIPLNDLITLDNLILTFHHRYAKATMHTVNPFSRLSETGNLQFKHSSGKNGKLNTHLSLAPARLFVRVCVPACFYRSVV